MGVRIRLWFDISEKHKGLRYMDRTGVSPASDRPGFLRRSFLVSGLEPFLLWEQLADHHEAPALATQMAERLGWLGIDFYDESALPTRLDTYDLHAASQTVLELVREHGRFADLEPEAVAFEAFAREAVRYGHRRQVYWTME